MKYHLSNLSNNIKFKLKLTVYYFIYRFLFKTQIFLRTRTSKILVASRNQVNPKKWLPKRQPRKARPLKSLQAQHLQRLQCSYSLKINHQRAQTPAPARKLAIREKALIPMEDHETSTTHPVKSSEVWPTSHTTTASMAAKARFIPWSRSIRHNCASTLQTTVTAHFTNSANSPMVKLSSGNQMT